jgi:hypothetical protein
MLDLRIEQHWQQCLPTDPNDMPGNHGRFYLLLRSLRPKVEDHGNCSSGTMDADKYHRHFGNGQTKSGHPGTPMA